MIRWDRRRNILQQFPGLGTRGKLAECYEKLGRFASAWQQYREVAQLATRQGDPAREQVAAERARSLEPKLSYLTISMAQANDAPGLVIKRGGTELERAKFGSAEPVDSGAITIEVSAPNRNALVWWYFARRYPDEVWEWLDALGQLRGV